MYLSDIFVSASINILTSQIPKPLWDAGVVFFLVAIAFFAISGLLLIWATSIKSAFRFIEDYYIEKKELVKTDDSKNSKMICWYEGLRENNLCWKLPLIFLVIICLLAASFTLLVLVK